MKKPGRRREEQLEIEREYYFILRERLCLDWMYTRVYKGGERRVMEGKGGKDKRINESLFGKERRKIKKSTYLIFVWIEGLREG